MTAAVTEFMRGRAEALYDTGLAFLITTGDATGVVSQLLRTILNMPGASPCDPKYGRACTSVHVSPDLVRVETALLDSSMCLRVCLEFVPSPPSRVRSVPGSTNADFRAARIVTLMESELNKHRVY